jgi:hypothetical protein
MVRRCWQGGCFLAVFPGGKSLCYQLPALLDGLTLVVSPLIALMKVDALNAKGSPYADSTLDADQAREVYETGGWIPEAPLHRTRAVFQAFQEQVGWLNVQLVCHR